MGGDKINWHGQLAPSLQPSILNNATKKSAEFDLNNVYNLHTFSCSNTFGKKSPCPLPLQLSMRKNETKKTAECDLNYVLIDTSSHSDNLK